MKKRLALFDKRPACRRSLLVLLIAAFSLSAILVTSCGGASSNISTGGAQKTQLNVAVELFAETLEPSTDWESWYVMRFGAGETLVMFGEDGSFEPWLAERWEVAEDNLTWTFKIREGVRFSNGKAMKASDVVASIERLYRMEDPANGGNGNPHGYFTYSEISADDSAYVVTIKTDAPTPDLPGCMAYPWTLIIDVEGSEKRNIPTEGPIGTGPYAFASFTQDSDAQMVRNQYYWGGQVPYERVNIMRVPEAATRMMALQDGSADMALNIQAADRRVLEQSGGYALHVVASTRTAYAHINMQGVMGNPELRKAVLTAIDGKTIADITTSGAYTYGYAAVPSTLDFGYEDLKFDWNYNPAAAIKILDDAGIVDTNGDGYRELEGRMIDINYIVTSNRSMDLIAQAQAAQLDRIGIKCTVTVSLNQSEVLNNHLFDMACSNEVVTPTGDPAQFLRHWYSGSDDNYAQYSNSAYDALYDKLSAEFDPATRKEYMTGLQQILLDDAALLVYGYFNYNICASDSITGIYANPNDFYWVVSSIQAK